MFHDFFIWWFYFRKFEEDRSGYSRQGYDRRRDDEKSSYYDRSSRRSQDDEDSRGQLSYQKKSDDELQRRNSSDMEMDDGEDELDNYVNNVASEGKFALH